MFDYRHEYIGKKPNAQVVHEIGTGSAEFVGTSLAYARLVNVALAEEKENLGAEGVPYENNGAQGAQPLGTVQQVKMQRKAKGDG